MKKNEIARMRRRFPGNGAILLFLSVVLWLAPAAFAADHNDPNAINSIFFQTEANPADLYDLYGFPTDDSSGGEKVIIALTFASVPATGVFDPDLLYRILISPNPRAAPPMKDDAGVEAILKYFDAIKDKYLGNATEIFRLIVRDKRIRVGKSDPAIVCSRFAEQPDTQFLR
jgi:hypothetical protein